MEYNITSEDKIKKYTLNIPIELFDRIKLRARKAGIYRVSIYIRALLEIELSKENPLNMKQILLAQEESKRIASAEHRREYLDNIKEGGSISKNIKIIIDKLKVWK